MTKPEFLAETAKFEGIAPNQGNLLAVVNLQADYISSLEARLERIATITYENCKECYDEQEKR